MTTALPTLDPTDSPSGARHAAPTRSTLELTSRIAPHVVVWALILVPAIRTMSRGWRPVSDDAAIAIRAWATFSLHPPLVGQFTGATASQNTADPGPLEFWLLGPFVHLDHGQGALLGSALLCAAILSITLYVLQKTTGTWAAVIFSLVVADLAVTSPTPFVDPVWNLSFAFFWFLAFMGVALAVAQGNLRFLALLVFIASVTVDSHLLFLPSTACVLIAAPLCGWFFRKPSNYRWIWWTVGVAVACWGASVLQQLFGAEGNISLLLHSEGVFSADKVRTFGFDFGLRALSRAASLNPIWASPRPIAPFASGGDVLYRNLLPCLVLPVIVAIGVVAWKRKLTLLCSMCVITTGASIGLVAMYARIPYSYLLSFTWVNLAIWVVGICIWLTLGMAVVTAVQRSRFAVEWDRFSPRSLDIAALCVLGVATVAGTFVATFPYGNQQFLLDFPGMNRIESITSNVEHRVPRGTVGIAIRYTGKNYFQILEDEHGAANLLLVDGWEPGLEPSSNGLLDLPIHPQSPFVVITEDGTRVTGYQAYRHYVKDWASLPAPPTQIARTQKSSRDESQLRTPPDSAPPEGFEPSHTV